MFRPFKSARFMISVAAASMSSVLAGCGGGGGGGGALVASAPVPASSKSSPASIPAPAAVYKQPSNTFYEYAGSFISEGLASRMQIAGSRDADGKFTGTSLDVTLDEVKDRAFVTTSINNNQSTSQENKHSIYVLSTGMGVTSDIIGVVGSNDADLYRVRGSSGDGDYVSVSNLLGSSLGTTSLSYAYVGIGTKASTAPSGGYDVYMSNFFGGQKTQVSDMPSSGTANYAGGFSGESTGFGSGGLSVESLDGNVNLAANFGAKTIQGSVDGIRFDSTSPSPFSIGVNGVISGNQFSGNAHLIDAKTGKTFGTQTSVMQGGFFGPQAAEAAGALAVKATGNGVVMFVNGSFGAKKQ